MNRVRRVLASAAVAVAVSGVSGGDDRKDASPQSLSLKVSIGFEDDVDRTLLEEWVDRVEKASALWFELSEGQVFIAEATIEDKTCRGRIVIPSGQQGADVVAGTDAMAETQRGGSAVWRIRSVGSPDGRKGMVWGTGTVLAHELGHAVFGLPDERDDKTHAGIECKTCIMGTDPTRLCGPGDHGGSIKHDCKSAITALHPGLRFPNPKFRPGAAPPRTKLNVIDRGPKDASPELVPLTPKEAKAVKELEARGRALAVRVGWQGKPTAAQRRRMISGVLEIDALLRALTADQLLLSQVVLEGGLADGFLVVESGSEDRSVLGDKEAMWKARGDGWLIAGDIPFTSLARYALAGLLKVSESDASCEGCVFNLKIWDERTRYAACGPKSHKGEGRSCVEQLVEKWTDAGVVSPDRAKPAPGLPALPRFRIVESK